MADKKNNKRLSIQSPEVLEELARAEAQPLPEPPMLLSEDARQYWPNIIRAKARTAWTSADLLLACQLAADLAEIDYLATEPRYHYSDKGIARPHPAQLLRDKAVKRVQSLVRQLQIHALSTQGHPGNRAPKNQKARELQEALESDNDGLIARPEVEQ